MHENTARNQDMKLKVRFFVGILRKYGVDDNHMTMWWSYLHS